MRDIKDHVAFVTGGENGLGNGIAKKFAEEGAKVVIFGIDAENGEKAAKELGGRFIKGDVSKEEDVANAMNIIKETYGKLDFAVNCAGIASQFAPLGEASIERFDQIMAVNVRGVFLCMRNEINLMLEKGFGKIVNISSEAALFGVAGISAYSASKCAVNGMTRAAAVEYAGNGININAVAPGAMMTPMAMTFPKEQVEAIANIRPTKRMVSVENVAEQVVFMCSKATEEMIGVIVPMEGGSATW